MKLVSYVRRSCTSDHENSDALQSYGIHVGRGIVDLRCRLPRYSDLKALLEGNGLEEARAYQQCEPDLCEPEVVFLPIIQNSKKIFCVGMNYADKRSEFGETNTSPTLFIRFPDSQTAHNGPLLKPAHTKEFDYEGELAVVIGKSGYQIPASSAMEHVAGYSCYMDGSVRDWQHTWFTAGKNWLKTGSFGPWLVTSDEIENPHSLSIKTFLNGEKVQDDYTGNMIHSIPDLIAYISTFSPLSPGDVMITGSPGGVGKKRAPPLFLKNGDVVEVEIEKIGCLHNIVVDAPVNPSDYGNSSDIVRSYPPK